MTLVYVAIIVLALGVAILAHWFLDKLNTTNSDISALHDCFKDENGALDRKIDRVDFSLGEHLKLFKEFNEEINDRIDKIIEKAGILEDRVQVLEEEKVALAFQLFMASNELESGTNFMTEDGKEIVAYLSNGEITIKANGKKTTMSRADFYEAWFNREYVQIP